MFFLYWFALKAGRHYCDTLYNYLTSSRSLLSFSKLAFSDLYLVISCSSWFNLYFKSSLSAMDVEERDLIPLSPSVLDTGEGDLVRGR